MRTITTPMLNALNAPAYTFKINGTLEPSRIFFPSLSEDYHPAWGEALGLPAAPIMQDISVSASGVMATFYNHESKLQYQIATSATVVDTTVPLLGKPGAYGDHLFYVSDGTLYHRDLDWTAIASLNASIFTSGSAMYVGYSGSPALAVHGISPTECIVFVEDNGGFRAHYHNTSGDHYVQPGRFMYPHIFKYFDEEDGETERTMQGLIMSSCAAKVGNEVFAYMSNCGLGSVEGFVLSMVSLEFSDIFVAVPSELSSSMCEFRCANAFVQGTTIYMSGQFVRRDNAETYTPYTLIVKSTNGRNFTLDQNTLVSTQGYRLLAYARGGYLYAGGCNRTASETLTYYFSGASGSPSSQAIEIPGSSILNFSDNGLATGMLGLKASDHVLMFHPYMKAGSRVLINGGYKTSGSPSESQIKYGSYIIGGFSGSIVDGERRLSPQLMNMSEYNLSSMSSPFYTQVISKSSIKDDLIDRSNMYGAPASGIGESSFSVDFWDAEAYDDPANGITGLAPALKGGVGGWWLSAGAHKIGCKCKDIISLFGVDNYPVITATTVHVKIYGWSSNRSGSENELVGITLFLNNPDNDTAYTKVVPATKRWPNTYRDAAAGDEPIEYDITGLTVDHEITQIGIYIQSSLATITVPARVDVTSGAVIYRDTASGNAPWVLTSGSGFEIPGTISPRIMFSTKPYNAYNFMIRSRFHCTVQGYTASLPCGYGLVGLAEDGGNYVLGRYNVASGNLEVVKARNRIETVLTSGSPSVAIGADCDMMFAHKDGRFSISVFRDNVWTEELVYEWQEADDWMFTNSKASMHTGIYAIIRQPYFYTTGLDTGASEDITNSDAIPLMPGLDPSVLDAFPSSGVVTVDSNDYSYSGKFKPTIIRGPYQLRNNGDGKGGSYAPPYGNGQPGIECLDFDWNKSDGSYQGYVIAVDSSGSYMCTWTQWRIWITTGGQHIDLPDRARYSASGSNVGDTYFDLANRVYLTGGLLNPTMTKGEGSIHALGTMVELKHTGSIWCQSFEATSGDIDVTVEDLVDRISRTCNAVAEFPGDILFDSKTYSGSEVLLAAQTLVPGFDVRFTMPVLGDGEYIDVLSDTQARGYVGTSRTFIRIKRISAGSYEASFYATSPNSLIASFAFSMTNTAHFVRILYHDNFATLYIDERWIYTFGMSTLKNDTDPIHDEHGIVYSDDLNIRFSSSTNPLTISNVRVCELADWREAVYIDLETDGRSAIQSVIQERPVEIVHKADGSIAYTYEPIRSVVTPAQHTIRSHTWKNVYPQAAGSDAIIYYVDVKTYQQIQFAEKFGLSTKVVRMPNLEQGALKAAKILLKRLFEQNEIHTLEMRPDLRIEPGDVMDIEYTSTGARKTWDIQIIVEDVALNFQDDSHNSMQITGRLKT